MIAALLILAASFTVQWDRLEHPDIKSYRLEYYSGSGPVQTRDVPATRRNERLYVVHLLPTCVTVRGVGGDHELGPPSAPLCGYPDPTIEGVRKVAMRPKLRRLLGGAFRPGAVVRSTGAAVTGHRRLGPDGLLVWFDGDPDEITVENPDGGKSTWPP